MLDALLAHGRPADEPAALIYDGTLPTQETIARHARRDRRSASKQLERSARRRSSSSAASPALREHLRWFDARPLFGKRILVTRPREQAAEIVELLEALGAEADRGADDPHRAAGRLRPARRGLRATSDEFDWIVFSSANAVDAFIERLLASPLDVRALDGVKLCAVGPATAERLARIGLKVDLVPAEYRAEAVVAGDARGRRRCRACACCCRAPTSAAR